MLKWPCSEGLVNADFAHKVNLFWIRDENILLKFSGDVTLTKKKRAQN